MIVGMGWRIVVPTLYAYASSSAGNGSCYKNCSATAAAPDYHIRFGWNAIAKATANF